MRRHLAASALFAAGLLAVTASAQPPAGDKAPAPFGGPKQKIGSSPAPAKKADGVDAQIEAALANDPDVRMARAKIQLAEAELAKARQGAAVRVTTLRATVQELRSAVAAGADRIAHTEGMVKKGFASPDQVQAEKDRLEAARARLAGAEAELKLVVGDGPKPGAGLPPDRDPVVVAELARQLLSHAHYDRFLPSVLEARRLSQNQPVPACTGCHDLARDGNILEKNWHGCDGIIQHVQAATAAPAAPKGPVSDRLRAALDKTVLLGAKDAKVTFEQAVEAFKKDAGLDVPVRAEVKVGPVVSLGESLPVGAWLQLFADGTPGTRLLVREYGLLVTTTELAPPDGVSVFDFWKQKPAAKPTPTRVMLRHGGKQTELQEAEAEALTAVARQLVARAARRMEGVEMKQWAAAAQTPAGLVGVQVPDAGSVVPGARGEATLLVGLSKFPHPDPVVLMQVKSRLEGGDAVYSFSEFPPEAGKAFAEVVARVAPGK